MIFEVGVLHRLPKWHSNGVISIVFCLDILNGCIITCIECSRLKFLFECAFMHDNWRLIDWIKRSNSPISLWSSAGAYIGVILFSVQNVSHFFPVKHLACSNLIVLGTPWFYINLLRNLITFGPDALFTISAVGYFEYRSTHVMKYCSMPFS